MFEGTKNTQFNKIQRKEDPIFEHLLHEAIYFKRDPTDPNKLRINTRKIQISHQNSQRFDREGFISISKLPPPIYISGKMNLRNRID